MFMALAKTDCLTLDQTVLTLNISKATLYGYMRHLGITSHKFPFDRKSYIAKSDVETIRKFTEEIK